MKSKRKDVNRPKLNKKETTDAINKSGQKKMMKSDRQTEAGTTSILTSKGTLKHLSSPKPEMSIERFPTSNKRSQILEKSFKKLCTQARS